MTELHKKRQERRKITAEDFTPQVLVDEMLSKVPDEIWNDENKTFLDPAAGNGNILVSILKRKLELGHNPIKAISTLYGVELMHDNVEELHHKLLDIIGPYIESKDINKVKKIIETNIVCHDALTWDFENWKSTIEKVKVKELF